MILTCPNCATRYQTDPSTIVAPGRNVRCAKCGQVWFQTPPEVEVEPEQTAEPPALGEHPAVAASSTTADARMGDAMAPMVPYADAGEGRSRGRMGRAIGGLVLIAIVVAAVFALVEYRQTIATLWPKSASLYAAIGMKVNVLGLDFRDVKSAQSVEAGQPLLQLSGNIVNVSEHAIPVPLVRVALIDGQSREVYHWTFNAGAGTLAPGASASFTTRLSAPPEEAKSVAVRFVEAGEQ